MSNKIVAICLDCGDTLVDEATEEKQGEVSLRADLISGADELMHELKRRGYPLALVADGPSATFKNNLEPYGLFSLFDAYAISEELKVSKPNSKMFHHALAQLDISKDDYGKVIMIGNNLERDIKGANDLGIISVWLDWSPRRSKVPADTSEEPQYTIKKPLDLIGIIDLLEKSL